MKKQLLFLVLMMLPVVASAITEIDGIYYNLNSGTQTAEVTIQMRKKYSGDLVIPSSVTYNGVEYSVTGILGNAFAKSTDLTSVTIPSSVTSIDTRRTSYGLFDGCTSLTTVVIDGGNAVYDSRENCNAIIETASNTLLYGCNGSTIPNGVVGIGEYAFTGNSCITYISIPNSVTTIDKNAFKNCTNLAKVELNCNALVSEDRNGSPYMVDFFGDQVKEYVIGEDVTSIGSCAFADCYNLTKVSLPDGLTSIGMSAFSFCYNLAEINIPSSVTTLGLFAFNYCGGLTRVEINNNAIVSKDYRSNYDGLSYVFSPSVKEYVIGEDVTRIGNYAFSECHYLTSIIIPKSVTDIGTDAFQYCDALQSIQVEDGNPVYDSREDCNAIIKTASNTLLWGCQNTTIPNGIISIANKAFAGCSGLTSISIPNSVSNIGDNAFESCKSLTSITIPDNLQAIGYGVFMGCESMESVSIPNSVIAIGDYAFASCYALSSITLPNRLTIIGDYAFFSCQSLTSVIIPKSVQSIGKRAFNNCSVLAAIKVENGNPVYDSREDCNAIIYTTDNALLVGCQNTVIPNGVESIGSCAFWGSLGLTSIIIPDGVTSIGECAFYNCPNLTTVVIPSSVTKIERSAFYYDPVKDLYLYAEQVPEATELILYEYHAENATLHVPATAVEAYKNAEYWKDFGSIVALTDSDPNPTGIKSVSNSAKAIERYYTIDGKLLSAPQRGLNIIKMSDGKTRKVVIK